MTKKSKLLTLVAFSTLLVSCQSGATTPVASADTSSSDNSTTSSVTSSTLSFSDTTSDTTYSGSVISPTGALTSEMLGAVSDVNITVKGTLTDHYYLYSTRVDTINNYDMTVMMDEGKWYGEYAAYLSGNTLGDVQSDNYRKGEEVIANYAGQVGHAVNRVTIGKNNTTLAKPVTNYISDPALWENQHYWNHMRNLNINNFKWDSEVGAYSYSVAVPGTDDPSDPDYQAYVDYLYLMTYMSFSLTPLMEDTLDSFYVFLDSEGEAIDKIVAYTEVLNYYATETAEDPYAYSYSGVELKFSDVGTTVVPEPTPYEAPLNGDKLEAALTKMKSAKNYTTSVVDTTTSAPSIDDGDYSYETTQTSSPLGRRKNKVANYTDAVGTVGTVGKVTEDAVLYARTGRYTATLDGNEYHTSYSGIKQNSDSTYDRFEYSTSQRTLVGTAKKNGSLFDALPNFDFSSNVFEFRGSSTNAQGKSTYNFALRDSAITRDVAMAMSDYTYASSASNSVTTTLTIRVDDEGNLVSTTFPYSLTGGTYTGYCTTTYSDFGTTTLDSDLFDDYVPYVIRNSWSEYTFQGSGYRNTDGTTDRNVTVDTAISTMYGADASKVITPEDILTIFENFSGPWHDRDTRTNTDGSTWSREEISLTTKSENVDENSQIADYQEKIAALNSLLTSKGYSFSAANSDDSRRTSRYATWINGDVQIVVENIGSAYFYISFYKTGEWTLNRS